MTTSPTVAPGSRCSSATPTCAAPSSTIWAYCPVLQPFQGPYADTPCVVGESDNHIKRKTAEDLDQLPDASDPEYTP
jgi:hypothetical protein